ncbi:MAG: FAD-dependent oxidoreductase [Acidobacteria bacterium]|nr:FAD-dependent oxidoreductase [Acidobacteriota bacterium]
MRTFLWCTICPLLAAQYDLVVYGGTAGGAIAAVAAARDGLRTALLEPRDHIGGMMSGGLSWTDYGKKEVIGGYALEFFFRAGRYYNIRQYGQEAAWNFEPRVAEQIFREMLREAGVTVLFRHRLREKDGVLKSGRRITGILMENGESFEAKVFSDSTYEGDLMAQAGVSYTWGREGAAQYGESLAGVRDETPYHQFKFNLSPYDAAGKLLPEIQPGPYGRPGDPDKKVQAYNFRLCLSSDPANQVPYPQPPGYSPRRYELMARLLQAFVAQNGRAPRMNEVLKPDPIPNRKVDVNNQGAFSTDYIGGSWEYPESGYARRDQIWRAHIDYIAGLLYFLATDPQAPPSLQKEIRGFGLAKDEFTDTAHWPHQLYVREARRMVGEYVIVQKDLQTDRAKPDPIGMGSYNSDSHNIQRIVTPEGWVRNEGDMQVAVQPYQIPYRILVPKRGEVENLLVPVCFSASHVAYSSVRMEPQYMILGQAAGAAAKMAIAAGIRVQDIDTRALTARLRSQGAVMEYVPSAYSENWNLFRR